MLGTLTLERVCERSKPGNCLYPRHRLHDGHLQTATASRGGAVVHDVQGTILRTWRCRRVPLVRTLLLQGVPTLSRAVASSLAGLLVLKALTLGDVDLCAPCIPVDVAWRALMQDHPILYAAACAAAQGGPMFRGCVFPHVPITSSERLRASRAFCSLLRHA